MNVSRRNIAKFDYRAENASLNFNEHLMDSDSIDILKNRFLTIVSTLINLNNLEKIFGDVISEIEDNLIQNIYKLVLSEFEKIKNECIPVVKPKTNLFNEICMFTVFKSILVYCANISKILELLLMCAHSKCSSSNGPSADALDKFSIFTIYDKIQSVITKIIACLNNVPLSKINKLSKTYQDAEDDDDGGDDNHYGDSSQDGGYEDEDIDQAFLRDLNDALQSTRSSAGLLSQDFKFKITLKSAEDDNFDKDKPSELIKIDATQIAELQPFSFFKDFESVKYTYVITHKFITFIEESAVIILIHT